MDIEVADLEFLGLFMGYLELPLANEYYAHTGMTELSSAW